MENMDSFSRAVHYIILAIGLVIILIFSVLPAEAATIIASLS
jgi:hypothetical protein